MGPRGTKNPTVDLGARIKQARSDAKLSLRALGELCGFSAAFLSQVELGQASPSLGSLGKIAAGLGLTLAELVSEQQAPPGPTIRRKRDETLRSEWSKATVQSLLPASARHMSAIVVSLEPGGRSGKSPHAEGGALLAYCIRGSVKAVVGDASISLAAGDSVFFEVEHPSSWSNAGTHDAEFLLVAVLTS